jgi:poly(beta-D-mannuronate) C5 epimerase
LKGIVIVIFILAALLLVGFLIYFSPISEVNAADTCVTYSSSSNLITLTCGSRTLTQIYNNLQKYPNVLKKEDNISKIWLLNADLAVQKGATLSINSTDTSWLKINSPSGKAGYRLLVGGNIIINSVKITSWDIIKKNYVKTKMTNLIPRSYIIINGTGTANITNSEIAYLGYAHRDSYGLTYYSGATSHISNNKIHDLWYGFYSSGNDAHNIVIENNEIYRNSIYGIDLHTGSHDLVIRKNIIHDNGKHGIVCSSDCYNILIESNRISNNFQNGILLSNNISRSIIRDNSLYNNKGAQIFIQGISNNNSIYHNTINGGESGITISESSNNHIERNVILNPSQYGIHLLRAASQNVIGHNKISDASNYTLFIQDPHTDSNVIENNLFLTNSRQNAIKLYNTASSSHTRLINNTISTASSSLVWNMPLTIILIIVVALGAIIIAGRTVLIKRRVSSGQGSR